MSFFLHELTDVSKANLLWAQGLLYLSLMFDFAHVGTSTGWADPTNAGPLNEQPA